MPEMLSGQPEVSAPGGDLEAVLANYLRAAEDGRAPDRMELLARHPDLAPELATFFAGQDQLGRLTAPLREAVSAVQESTIEEKLAESGRLGDFRILREIGRGGMGVVYEAEQISLGRRVALKVLPFASALDGKQLQRFKNEAQAAAGLQHTNIVPVYFVGCERGVHFYAMQFVEGQTLAALIQELRQLEGREAGVKASGAATKSWAAELISGQAVPPGEQAGDPEIAGSSPLPPFVPPYEPGVGLVPSPTAETITPPVGALSTEHSRRRPAFFRTVANLGIQAAEALEHAHSLGVIHRDIKPGNLMVEGEPGASATGVRLWITDFGLAHCQGGSDLTMSGDLLGTLRYMSPEQALAKRVLVDHRTDIYSLGVTLYELLTLEPAFPSRDRQELLRRIAFEEPKLPRRLSKAIPVELETIVLKAMEKNPADRYASAQELADDLERYLKNEPIRARRPTLVHRFRKWARRHPGVAWMTVWLLVVLALGSTVSTMLIAHQRDLADARAREADDNAEAALGEKRRADDNAAEAIGRLYISDMRLAQRAWEDNQIGWLLELLESQRPERTGGRDLRGFEWHYWWRLCHSDLLTLKGHTGWVTSLGYSPDGNRIVSGSLDKSLKVWDAVTGKETLTLKGHSATVNSVAYSPDGKLIVSGSGDGTLRGDGTVKIWDSATGQEILTLNRQKQPVKRVAYFNVAHSPDGKRIVSCANEMPAAFPASVVPGQLIVWDSATGQEILAIKGHTGWVTSVAYSPDGKRIISGSDDNTLKVWDGITGKEILTLRGHSSGIISVACSPDRKRIASGSHDKTIKVWDAATGQEMLNLKGHTNAITSVAYSPDSKRILSASRDNTIKVWDTTTGQEMLTLKGHTSTKWGILNVACSPDGKRIVSGSGDNTIKVWDAMTRQETMTLKGGATTVGLSPDGKRIVSGGGTIKVSDAATGQEILSFNPKVDPTDPGWVRLVAYSPDGTRIVSDSDRSDVTLMVWDAANGQETLRFKGDPGFFVRSLAYSPDGKWIVTGSHRDKTVTVWDAATGQKTLRLNGHTDSVNSVAYSPDGSRIVSSSNDFTIKVWDAATGQELLTLKAHDGPVYGVAYSPDGRRIVSGSYDNTLKLWDAATGQETLTLKGHTDIVQSVAFSPDGNRIVSGSHDNTLKVWDAERGQETLTLKGHTGWVTSVAYSPDGKRIASGSHDMTIKVWDATPMEEKPLLAADPNNE
jgi:WD40 repeat protein/serine/threonine protein kinase